MKLVVCAVYDTKVGAYAQPFFARTKGEALRSFSDACSDEKLPFKAHPSDYRLCFLGEFDDQAGSFLHVGPPELLIEADQVEAGR